MNETLKRLKGVISYSELKVVKTIIREIGENTEKEMVNSKVAESAGVVRSVVVNAMRLLEVAGVLETRSMGAKGTYIKVLDQVALKEIANF